MHKSECLLRLIPSVCPAEDGERWCMTALDGTAVSDNCLRVHCLCCIDRDGIIVALCRIYLIRIPLRRILQQVFALTFILLWVVPLSAQQGIVVPSDSTVRYLEESVIVGHSQSGRYKETIPAQVLGGKDLERLNSLSVADALRYFSGVQLKDYGGVAGLKTVNVRSLGTNHVAVFYDGIQLGNAQNGQTDLGRFSLDDIGEICLYNGQKSDIFQSARDFGSSSSIYITTSEPHFAPGRRYSLKASVKTGSFGLVNPSFRTVYKISDKVSAGISAGWTNATGRYKFRCRGYDSRGRLAYDTTAYRHNGDICATRVEASVHGALSHGKWNMRVYNYNSNRGIPGAVVSNVFSNGERMRDNNFFVQGHFENGWTRQFRSMVNAKFASDYTFYEDKDPRTLFTSNRYRQKEAYVSSANLFSINDFWDVSMSFDFQWNWLDADKFLSVNVVFPQPVRFTEMLSLATALDLGRFKMQASILGYFIQDRARKSDLYDSSRNEASPALTLSYRLIDGKELYLRGFCKRSFRMPTFNDLYYTNSANVWLKPERTLQTDIGVKYSESFDCGFFRNFDIVADGYWNKVDDKIIAYPKGQQFRWTMLNLGKVDIRGVDASASFGFRAGSIELVTKLQYTWQRAVDITDSASSYYKNQIPYVPEHSGTAVVSLYWKGWCLGYTFLYAGERYSQKENVRRNLVQPYYTSDLSVQKSFNLRENVLKASLEVNNLLGQDYEVVLNYPMPKTNFKVSLSIEL